MLIHGAIIARELGIPCVNGVANVVGLLQDGDRVTVDGYLGIVTIGTPEFSLELGVTENDAGAGLGRPSGLLPVGALDASGDSR
jgi:phosphoenolpyruvate synthase/pyruvate phosphate dikinase